MDELAQLLKALGISLRTTAVEDIMREVSAIVGDQHMALGLSARVMIWG